MATHKEIVHRIVTVLLIAGVVACSKSSDPPTPPRTTPVAPNAPLNLSKPDEARVQLDLAAVRAAVERAKQIDGKTPASLDEMGVKLNYPADLTYDAATGAVQSKTYPQH